MNTSPFALRALAFFLLAAGHGPAGFGAESEPKSTAVSPTSESRFTEVQREFVHNWIRETAPGCPRELAEPAVNDFLEELRRAATRDLEQLLTPAFQARKHQARLLRLVGVHLTGPAHANLREEIARRRIQAVLDFDEPGGIAHAMEATTAITKIKALAPVHPRRLFEGRMDDDELALQLKKVRNSATDAPPAAPTKPREFSAADIVAEFARRNQDGTAAQRLRAFAFEIEFTPPSGEKLEMFLFRLRPDRFRLVVRTGGATRTITAYDGNGYWQLGPGQPVRAVPAKAIGELRHLREFVDPLLAETGFSFERLADGTDEGRKVYRIGVRRTDGTGHVALIDQESFRQVGRETEAKQIIRYSDFRPVGGLTMPFREESRPTDGGPATVIVIRRATADPGLVQALFAPPESGSPDYFALEGMLARADPATTITGPGSPPR